MLFQIVFYGQTALPDSVIHRTQNEMMFFNKQVFLKQKYQQENFQLKKGQLDLLKIITKKDSIISDDHKVIALNGQEKDIAAQQLNIVKLQLKDQKRSENKLIAGGSIVTATLLFGLGYFIVH